MWRNPNSLKLYIVLAFFCQFSLSCIYRGCRDTDAENYKPKANVDCSCCAYYGRVQVWYTFNFYETRVRDKIAVLRYYVDSVFYRETTVNLQNFYRGLPIAEKKFSEYEEFKIDDENIISVNLDGKKTKEVLIEIKDQNDLPLFSKLVEFKANRYVPLEME